MFGSVSRGGQRSMSSGLAGLILVPKRFVWPYGGRRVFLTGSFTRWSGAIPMSPMEGCPNIFQVVCNLTPGFHQYKFNVDGEWRHDEQQPFVSGNFGVVNSIYVVREPAILPAILRTETPGRSHMEVDNNVFGHVVSRHHISTFLSTHTAYELLPESGKVIALDIDLPVQQAFHVLFEQKVPTAPLWDSCKKQFVGVLSAMDFILILKELDNRGSSLTKDQLETCTIAVWKEGKLQQCGTDSDGRKYPQRFIHAGPNECLKDVALKFLQNKVATVPIIHSSEDDSFPKLLHLASLSGILNCICRHFKHSFDSLPILQLPIGAIPLGTWAPKVGESNKQPLAMLKPNASLDDALSLLIQAEVSSIPIVDDHNSLLDIYSRSDITALVKDEAYAGISLSKFSIHQALLLGRSANSHSGLHSGRRCHVCLRSDSLHKVMERLANPGVRRLVIVEGGSMRIEGIISLGDVFRFLLG